MKKPVLVIMAAGMGSRYGGLKQIDPVDNEGDIIIDFSIYDALQAGFEKIIFIIKKSVRKSISHGIFRLKKTADFHQRFFIHSAHKFLICLQYFLCFPLHTKFSLMEP